MKFLVPALPGGYVPRPRLHAALDAVAQLPLTVVAGRRERTLIPEETSCPDFTITLNGVTASHPTSS